MSILTDTLIQDFITDHQRAHVDGLSLPTYVQPASIDLPVGSQIYHVKHPFLAFNHTVQYIAEHLQVQQLDCTHGCTLYKHQTYLIPCLDIHMPSGYTGSISPKSSLGRIDVHVRAMIDYGQCYDHIPSGTTGTVWLQVTPQSFNIQLTAGQTLTQIMISQMDTQSSQAIPQVLFDQSGQTLEQTIINNQILISTAVPKPDIGGVVGYKARTTDQIIDLSKLGGHAAHRFFDEVGISGGGDHGKVNLERGRFYILASREYFQVPHEYSLELLPSSHLIGEMRAHYAGFFDPGFGLGCPAQGVLEVRPYEDMIVYDGQPICLIQSFTNVQPPTQSYGSAKINNNYQGQSGPKLAKYFSTN